MNYQCAINLIVQLSCVDDDMSVGSKVAESKVGRVGKPSTSDDILCNFLVA